MRQRTLECCAALRLGREAEAASLLMPLLEAFMQTLGDRSPTAGDGVLGSVGRALQCQQSQDLIGLADELEYVLLPLVEGHSSTG